MAELQSIELNLGPMVREAVISGLADMIDAMPQYRYAVILELLKRDPISRTLIAAAMGETTLREHKLDQSYGGDSKSWDEIMLEVLAELSETPSGRGEVL